MRLTDVGPASDGARREVSHGATAAPHLNKHCPTVTMQELPHSDRWIVRPGCLERQPGQWILGVFVGSMTFLPLVCPQSPLERNDHFDPVIGD